MLEIRTAEAVDHKKIIHLWHQGWHEAHAELVPSEVLRFRTKSHFELWPKEAREAFYVATDDGELLGFVSVKDAEVVKLYVGNHARGAGVAHALLSYAEHLLRYQGVSKAELYCTAGNIRAERFYEREGWNLSCSFEDALWLPEGVSRKIMVSTHRFLKDLTPFA